MFRAELRREGHILSQSPLGAPVRKLFEMPSSSAFPPLSLPAVPKHTMVWHFPVQGLLPFLLGKRLRKEFPVHLRLLLGETTALFFTVVVPVCTTFHSGCTIRHHFSQPAHQFALLFTMAGPCCSLPDNVKNARVSQSHQGSVF